MQDRPDTAAPTAARIAPYTAAGRRIRTSARRVQRPGGPPSPRAALRYSCRHQAVGHDPDESCGTPRLRPLQQTQENVLHNPVWGILAVAHEINGHGLVSVAADDPYNGCMFTRVRQPAKCKSLQSSNNQRNSLSSAENRRLIDPGIQNNGIQKIDTRTAISPDAYFLLHPGNCGPLLRHAG